MYNQTKKAQAEINWVVIGIIIALIVFFVFLVYDTQLKNGAVNLINNFFSGFR